MDPITQQIVLAAAGAGGGDKVYVDDVFSTFLYEGDAVGGADTQTINNGIDLAGEGGLVWIKNRTNTPEHILIDTERGATKYLSSNQTSGESTGSNHLNLFNNNGFRVGSDSTVNANNQDYVSWTFRKAPGFFDVVTYTGNGTAGRTVSHNLGSVPGMIIVKCTNVAEPWAVYHRSLGNTKYLSLSETSAEQSSVLRWNNTTPTSSVFTVGSDPNVNQNTKTYVAYIFAHDDAQFGTDSDESIIKCGTYTGGGTTNVEVNLGFEPQFVLLRCATRPGGYAGGWYLFDSMRGIFSGSNDPTVQAQESNAEDAGNNANISLTPTGFITDGEGLGSNASGGTYLYMAIRRPNKPLDAFDPPLDATDVFAIDTGNSSSTIPAFDSGFPVDFAFRLSAYASGGNNPRTHSRLQGPKELYMPLSNAEASDSPTVFDSMTGMSTGFNSNDIAWMFKRAPGFMDVVAYSGNSSNQNVSHNLGVAPEFYIVKRRSAAEDWSTYSASLGANKYTKLNQSAATYTNTTIWNNTSPTSSVFTVGNDVAVNGSGDTYIAFLFATLPGISFVGSYSGTGSALNVDCGFTSGARFVLIKRTDSSGNWYLFDTTRGIVSGNDFALALNLTSAQISGDYIDPLAAGFTINGSYAQWNESGGTYIFLAIA